MSAQKRQLIFSAKKEQAGKGLFETNIPWKILIVDDEPVIHSVTELVLRDFVFDDRKLQFFSAFSEMEAQKILESENDIAVAIIDIVMENDDSGLKLIRWIRDILKNKSIRLILRTGQPGMAPEKEIIHRYEINDYKEKTELTDVKLLTSLTVAIRGYRDLIDIQRNQSGFVRILDGAGEFWKKQDETVLMDEILKQFSCLFSFDLKNSRQKDCYSIKKYQDRYQLSGACGSYETSQGNTPDELDLENLKETLEKCSHQEPVHYHHPYLVCSLDTRQASGLYLVMNNGEKLDNTDKNILGAFLVNSSLAMDYWLLTASKSASQKNMLIFLSEVIEHHFMENGNHIRRVSEIMFLISRKMGIDKNKAELWKMASILHDLGKIGIPDHILKKPGKLTSEEFEIMKSHVLIGNKLLSSNKDEFFPNAAEIALYHHEKWNGKGYPNALKGEEIPFPARILAVIDVFDALTHNRIYKEAWTVDEALKYIISRKEEDFDSKIVDSFITLIPDIQWILDEYPD